MKSCWTGGNQVRTVTYNGHDGRVDTGLVELELLRRLLPALAVGSVEPRGGARVIVEPILGTRQGGKPSGQDAEGR